MDLNTQTRLLAQNVRHNTRIIEQITLLFFCHFFFLDLFCRYSTAFCSAFKLLSITNIFLRCSKFSIEKKLGYVYIIENMKPNLPGHCREACVFTTTRLLAATRRQHQVARMKKSKHVLTK